MFGPCAQWRQVLPFVGGAGQRSEPAALEHDSAQEPGHCRWVIADLQPRDPGFSSLFLTLLTLPTKVADQITGPTLATQCGRAIAGMGGWDRMDDFLALADDQQLTDFFPAVIRLCCGGDPSFIEALSAPPTRQCCVQFVELCVREQIVTEEDLDQAIPTLAQSGPLVELWPRIVDAVASACPRFLASATEHGESLCTRCKERLSSLWD
ncbi:hypothetical protein BC828DRAFT_384224 [Blastocladiella britannica]|nr:hypothetical protein BC828DRAFT_384224 [Blastocladiella britannica]